MVVEGAGAAERDLGGREEGSAPCCCWPRGAACREKSRPFGTSQHRKHPGASHDVFTGDLGLIHDAYLLLHPSPLCLNIPPSSRPTHPLSEHSARPERSNTNPSSAGGPKGEQNFPRVIFIFFS